MVSRPGDSLYFPQVQRRRRARAIDPRIWLVCLISNASIAMAQRCIPLSDSTQCPAFNQSSISTDSSLVALYPFLAFVSSTLLFDTQLSQYVNTSYVQTRYQQQLGCNEVNLMNTTSLYARYTTSVICNSIVQNSIKTCSLSSATSRPLCAESCAQQATGEEQIVTNQQLCGSPGPNFMDQIRADFTNCALPSDSLSGGCITGEQNEPSNCGFSNNLQGLCAYCATSSPNATDSCCSGSNVDSICPGVALPSSTSMPPLFPSSTAKAGGTVVPSANSSSQSSHRSGLSGGAIAGIVIGSLLGALLIMGLLLSCCLCLRRRRRGSQASIFNQPTPQRKSGPAMVMSPQAGTNTQVLPPSYGPHPGGRVARMSALEGTPSDSPSYGALGMSGSGKPYGDASSSDRYDDTPESRRERGVPTAGKRNGSLSSPSALGALDDTSSPNTDAPMSTPEGMTSGQSEQLPYFRDYYSQDEIHPNDRVSCLWGYQPRAGDEFELERGDMLRVVGIWDDGWATGVRINERAEDYDPKRTAHRDSLVSNSSHRRESPQPSGELKAFPLVCVCLPEYWKQATLRVPSDDGTGGPPQGFDP